MSTKTTILNEIKDQNPFYLIYVDDEPDVHDLVTGIMEEYGIKTLCFTHAKDAEAAVNKHLCDLVMIISDLQMPEINGFDFRKNVLKAAQDVPFLILSAHITTEIALKGVELKIAGFIDKPGSRDKLSDFLEKEGLPRILAIKENRELRTSFVDETADMFTDSEEIVLGLESNPNDLESINRFFGYIHTLKGASAFFEPKTLHHFAHKYEDLLKKLQRAEIAFTPPVFEALLRGFDVLKTLFNEFKTGQFSGVSLDELLPKLEIIQSSHSPKTSTGAKASNNTSSSNQETGTQQKAKEDVRVAVSLLDDFMQLSGEVTVVRNMLNKCFRSIEGQFPNNRDVDTLGELLDELHKINGGVQSKITEIRKISVKSILKPIPRAVRDISKALGKSIDLKIIGDDIRVDTSIADVLNSCLLHLVKNSMDHGLEMPQDRTLKGKPEMGTIRVQCIERFEEVWVEISDDGKGLNPEAIKNKLIKNGTHTADDFQSMSPTEINMMIFSPGFSTAEKVTDISGRGVGLSMVKESVDKIHGKIEIETVVDSGTKFRLILPIPKSVLIASCLSVTAKGSNYGFLQDDITRVLQLTPENKDQYLYELNGSKALVLDGELIPLVGMTALLEPHGDAEYGKSLHQEIEGKDQLRIVIIGPSQDSRKLAVIVDEIHDVEDTVIKTMHPVLNTHFLFKGVTYLDNGALGIIMDSMGIINNLKLTEHSKQFSGMNSTNQSSSTVESLPTQSMIIFKLAGDEFYSVPQLDVHRIEEIDLSKVTRSGDNWLMPYNDKVLKIIDISNAFAESVPEDSAEIQTDKQDQKIIALIGKFEGSVIAYKVDSVIDMCNVTDIKSDLSQPDLGIVGHFFYNNKTVGVLDMPTLQSFKSRKDLSNPSPFDGENETKEAS